MVVVDDLVVASLVVVAVVVGRVLESSALLVALGTDVVDRGIVHDLLALVLGEPTRLVALKDVYTIDCKQREVEQEGSAYRAVS